MHDLTNSDIEKRAVVELISYFEGQMDLLAEEIKKELEKKNAFYEVQGLKKKHRIDRECVRNAIKSINNKTNSSLSKRTGGNLPRAKKEKHLPENTEVA